MKVIHIPDDMSRFNGHREGVNVFESEIDAQGRRVVSPLSLSDFPDLFDGVDVVEVDYEPIVNDFVDPDSEEGL